MARRSTFRSRSTPPTRRKALNGGVPVAGAKIRRSITIQQVPTHTSTALACKPTAVVVRLGDVDFGDTRIPAASTTRSDGLFRLQRIEEPPELLRPEGRPAGPAGGAARREHHALGEPTWRSRSRCSGSQRGLPVHRSRRNLKGIVPTAEALDLPAGLVQQLTVRGPAVRRPEWRALRAAASLREAPSRARLGRSQDVDQQKRRRSVSAVTGHEGNAGASERFAGKVLRGHRAAAGSVHEIASWLTSEGGRVIATDLDLGSRRRGAPRRASECVRLDVRKRGVGRRARPSGRRGHAAGGRLINNAGVEELGTSPRRRHRCGTRSLGEPPGNVLVTRALLPMIPDRSARRGAGSIVNVASLMGVVSSRSLAAYCASKAGVVSLTRSPRPRPRRAGIRGELRLPRYHRDGHARRRSVLRAAVGDPGRPARSSDRLHRHRPVTWPHQCLSRVGPGRFVTGAGARDGRGCGAE